MGTEIQRQAVDWTDRPLLVLAGPGSGKTQVLTCRIARLLDSSQKQQFRILALTFTNKAADEMKTRVSDLVPGLEQRATIGTFHSFCAQVLRQHGVHIGVNPDFAIYSIDDDRRAVLQGALRNANNPTSAGDDVRYLALIDRLKAKLIGPENAHQSLARLTDAADVVAAYQLYEQELRKLNALDFNSLIFETYRLLSAFPAIAVRYRRSYPFWLIDEFQDTNRAQYSLIRALTGDDFRNVFAVADDDQIIYEWNGASYKQIQSFLADFSAEVTQLPTNYRCPAAIVEAANNLVVYNAQRASTKQALIAGKTKLRFPPSEHIQLRVFDSDELEAEGVAQEILEHGGTRWGQTVVLARTKALLERVNESLRTRRVPSVIAQRRDDFLSPEFRWLLAILKQLTRPLDRRNVAVLVQAFNRMAAINLPVDQVLTDAEVTGHGYFMTWLKSVEKYGIMKEHSDLLVQLSNLNADASSIRVVLDHVLEEFAKQNSGPEPNLDLAEDLAAWRELSRDIASHFGKNAPLDQFLQELQLRSKEPAPKPGSVTLMTIHGAKGREFDFVYLVGLSEDVLPSFQSKKKGDDSAEMEEERRNCFVAITRTRECLVLSRANTYRGWHKEPSRFLVEMQLVT